jgi:signal transduction histidine kinase
MAAVAPIRFDETLKPLLESAREQAQAKGLSFVEQLDTGDCLVQAEAADLARIFSNLLSNAVKYTSVGQVTVGARCADGWIEAWVQDTGMGISKEDQDRVFRAFYRTAAAKASGVLGTGLGLSIVRQVCERLGGSISMTSEEGRGTRFDIRIPWARMEPLEIPLATDVEQ